mmetsp:Transcript_39440/g.91057  ORF Transcript_39440/g.91057 Transcript_39440/m.91057 type:complete len:86 (-) Transcript_39440:196-453(-)
MYIGHKERAQQRTVKCVCQFPALWPSIQCKAGLMQSLLLPVSDPFATSVLWTTTCRPLFGVLLVVIYSPSFAWCLAMASSRPFGH